ncbi:AMP-binding protein [Mesorhizobium xinjiangense]|uniref:AMP-binding protein n=1 Tax=Mesorhizobium xinjiangense TaxID=2678685 RepID=UPI001F455959|nr:AMP-binding protein [Mesorhizobium xinjiangense]
MRLAERLESSSPADLAGLIISGDRMLSQDELQRRGMKIATGLKAMGIQEGDSIAVVLRNDFAFLETMLGANIAGVYVAAVNWHASAEEAAHILADSGAKLVVIHADLMAQFGAGIPDGVAVLQVSTPQEIATAFRVAALPAPVECDWDDWRDSHEPYDGPAAAPRSNIIYTSGTTGNPKGIVREPAVGDMAARVREVLSYSYGLSPDEPIRTAITGPLYHSAPNVYTFHAVRSPGGIAILQPRFDAEELLALIQDYKLTHLHLVPTMLVRLLKLNKEVRDKYDVSSLRYVVHGAAPCPPEVRRAMIDWFGPVIGEYYGASETGAAVALRPDEADAHADTVGRPTPWTRIEIIGTDGTPCRTGEIGEIFVKIDRYPSFEYRNRPGAADKVRRGDLVSAGDIGYLDAEGYLHLCDRKSDMIISGGVNIYPVEIEAALIDIPGVRDAAVFGIPNPEFGESVAACVATELDVAELREQLARRLARYKIPRTFRLIESLPREDSGKIRKKKLREALLAETAK